MNFLRATLAAAVVCVTFSGVADAAKLSAEQEQAALDFVMNDAQATIYHELGHLLIGEFGLNVLGKEEDAADSLAAIMMLTDEDDPEGAEAALLDAADAWYFYAEASPTETLEELSYFDDHSMDIQRAYAMVCMMVGAKPEEFKETADGYNMDQDTQDGCAFTYEQARSSWENELADNVADGTPGDEITVVYEDADKGFTKFENELKKTKVLEKAAARISSLYKLPRPLTILATQCDVENAWYSASEGKITFCYMMENGDYDLYINSVLPYREGGEAVDEPASPTEGIEPSDDEALPPTPKPVSRTAGSKGG